MYNTDTQKSNTAILLLKIHGRTQPLGKRGEGRTNTSGDLVLRRSSRLNPSTTLGISILPLTCAKSTTGNCTSLYLPCALGREGAHRAMGGERVTWEGREGRGHMGGERAHGRREREDTWEGTMVN